MYHKPSVFLFRVDLITHVGDVGRFGRVTIGHDNTGSDSNWYLERVSTFFSKVFLPTLL